MHLKGAVKNVHETFTSQFDFDIKTKIVSCRTADSKTGGQWYSDTSPLVFPASGFLGTCF